MVSIITPSYNCATYVSDCIKSILAQTYQNWELLFQDDCSTDNTKEIVEFYAATDSRIKYQCNDTNCGAAITRNNALRRATGKWIAFLDSDDIWKPEKLEKQVDFMLRNNYAFSYHAYTEITEQGDSTGVYVSGKRRVGKFDMFSCCWPGCLTVMYDREKIGLIQINDVRKNNDTAMWLKIVRKSSCYLLPENLAYYRKRVGSITPPTIFERVMAHYPLFRYAEEMNPIFSFFWTIMNVFGNSYKKIMYVKKY